jgi:hypothetical protein
MPTDDDPGSVLRFATVAVARTHANRCYAALTKTVEVRRLGRGCVWTAGCGVASGGALGREPASDWPPEGMPLTANAAACVKRLQTRYAISR